MQQPSFHNCHGCSLFYYRIRVLPRNYLGGMVSRGYDRNATNVYISCAYDVHYLMTAYDRLVIEHSIVSDIIYYASHTSYIYQQIIIMSSSFFPHHRNRNIVLPNTLLHRRSIHCTTRWNGTHGRICRCL